MEEEYNDSGYNLKSTWSRSMTSEVVAFFVVVGYFGIMILIGVLFWYRNTRRVKEKLKKTRDRKPQCFDQDNQVLKIKFYGINPYDSPG